MTQPGNKPWSTELLGNTLTIAEICRKWNMNNSRNFIVNKKEIVGQTGFFKFG